MNCNLCNQPIKNYDASFNHLEIDNSHSIDICQECVDKFVKWQSNIYAKLFPTNIMKKIYRNK